MNKLLLLQTAFKLKIFSVMLGLVNVFLTAQYYEQESVFEVFLLASVAVTFAISVMYLSAVHYLGRSYTLTVRKCDAAIHFVMGAISFSVWTVFLILMMQMKTGPLCAITAKDGDPAREEQEFQCFSRIALRIVLGVMCIMNSVIYGIICYILISDDTQYEIL
ncbi:uncharacterized protein LOC110849505 [Folsomia candida]|uniref:Uncharacterized protein n=1 Tax=Folsomia candida TaxID=158441 RepID=A0A226EE55_FOLCA|nr:uncharacterized protein LOC110849505 [Folsomia candida]OXA55337.1 hypothetical protein Fcan01_08593 [Folsomia candida]